MLEATSLHPKSCCQTVATCAGAMDQPSRLKPSASKQSISTLKPSSTTSVCHPTFYQRVMSDEANLHWNIESDMPVKEVIIQLIMFIVLSMSSSPFDTRFSQFA